MQDVPPEIYKTLIQISLRTILNHHRVDISGECMWVVIHWVEDIPINIPYLLVKKLHSALQESQLRKVKFSFPGTLQTIIDLCRPHATETKIGDINQHGKIYLCQNNLFIKHTLGNVKAGNIMRNFQYSLLSRMRN